MAEVSQANPAPQPLVLLPVESAVKSYLPGFVALYGIDPTLGRLLTVQEVTPYLESKVRQIVEVERERGSRPARRRFFYAERHGHAINVSHPPINGPALTNEQEVAQKLRDRLTDANNEVILLTQRLGKATEQIKRANNVTQVGLGQAASARAWARRWAKVAAVGWAAAALLAWQAFVG
jgi:hypothetical protein